MAKPRKQTYTMEMYLKKMKEQDIRSDQDVQRLSDQWNKNMVNELIASVLNGEYMPPIILGEEKNSQIWIIDGLQRSTALMMFRYGNYKITKSIEEPVIPYRAKARDAEGEPCIDGNGDIVWEDKEFDITRKTFDRLPEELQKKFNEYQVEAVIHEGYDMKQISKLVRRYNNHKAMNVSQKAFTFVDNYARKIREILKRRFFIECTGYTKNERRNGTLERIIMESVMGMFHLDDWKRSNQIGKYLNENSAMEEFDALESCIERLEGIITDGLYPLFTSRDSFLWFTLFHRFTQSGLDDGRFAEFLSYFKETTDGVDMDEFYGVGRNSSTKEKSVVVRKLDRLGTLMDEYLGIRKAEGEPELDTETMLEFVQENVGSEVTEDDISQYLEVLDALMEISNCDRKLLETDNKPSLVAIVAYSFEHDIDLENWITNYCKRNDDYISDQEENYRRMVDDLRQFMGLADVA